MRSMAWSHGRFGGNQWDASSLNTFQCQWYVVFESPVARTAKNCNWTGPEPVATGPAVAVLQLLEVVRFRFIRIRCVGEPPQDWLGPVSTGLWSLLTPPPPQCTANHDRRPP